MNSLPRLSAYLLGLLLPWAACTRADDIQFGRQLAIAVAPDQQTAVLAGSIDGKLYRLAADSLQLEEIQWSSASEVSGSWTRQGSVLHSETPRVELKYTTDGAQLIAMINNPSRLIVWASDDMKAAPKVVSLDGPVNRLAVGQSSDGQSFACVTSTWSKSAHVVGLDRQLPAKDIKVERIALEFMPQAVLSLGDDRFCIADAFNGRLAVVRATDARVESSHAIDGYHIGGLALDIDRKQLLISHQQLSRNAYTTQDDIHWGLLIKNVVSSVPLDALHSFVKRLPARQYRLGRVGKGAADPAGLLCVGERRAVAISGSHEVAYFGLAADAPKFVSVGARPTELFAFGQSYVLCINRLDHTVSVIDFGLDQPQQLKAIGQPVKPDTPVARGERAFFSAALAHDGWMSCNSCHIEGHTPDLLVDTQSDGAFGSPKRIPSLSNVAQTGPWSWTGKHTSLEEQLDKTLSTTMHSPQPGETVADLVAYLNVLSVTINSTRPSTDTPPALFQTRCARCHNPQTHYTSPANYDVGLADESGQRQFNPPSLEGVTTRQRFMHDARYNSLDQLLSEHPQQATPSEVQELKQYLQQL